MKERLQKVIANKGYCSRRKAEELILAGLVEVNGEQITELGTKVGPNDIIIVEGVQLEGQELVYYMLNKPKDYISSASDDKGRKVVVDLVRTNTANERVYPVGRLDRNTTGILLLTNDGEFMQTMTHPKFEIQKKYVATVKGIASQSDVNKLLRGVTIEQGVKVSADDVFILKKNKERETTNVEITIHDGKYHQVKRMFEEIGYPVKGLRRVMYGNLELGNMPLGSYRKLKKNEIFSLLKLAKEGKV